MKEMLHFEETEKDQLMPNLFEKMQGAENINALLNVIFEKKSGVERGDAEILELNVKRLIKEYKVKGEEVIREKWIAKLYDIAPVGFMDRVFDILKSKNKDN